MNIYMHGVGVIAGIHAICIISIYISKYNDIKQYMSSHYYL